MWLKCLQLTIGSHNLSQAEKKNSVVTSWAKSLFWVKIVVIMWELLTGSQDPHFIDVVRYLI